MTIQLNDIPDKPHGHQSSSPYSVLRTVTEQELARNTWEQTQHNTMNEIGNKPVLHRIRKNSVYHLNAET